MTLFLRLPIELLLEIIDYSHFDELTNLFQVDTIKNLINTKTRKEILHRKSFLKIIEDVNDQHLGKLIETTCFKVEYEEKTIKIMHGVARERRSIAFRLDTLNKMLAEQIERITKKYINLIIRDKLPSEISEYILLLGDKKGYDYILVNYIVNNSKILKLDY